MDLVLVILWSMVIMTLVLSLTACIAMDVHEHRKKMEYAKRDYVRAVAMNGQEIRGEIVDLPDLLPGQEEHQRVAILKVQQWDRINEPRYSREMVLYRTIRPGWKGRRAA